MTGWMRHRDCAKGNSAIIGTTAAFDFNPRSFIADQVVIQACAKANRDEVFVLDMGEPMKIINLAKIMIDLAGLDDKSA